MIAVSCLHCGKNLKVKDELAGKKVRCPGCKEVLKVPLPLPEDATVPPSAGRPAEEEATIPPSWSPPLESQAPHAADEEEEIPNGSDEVTEMALDAAAHYMVAGEIARGGMGAIKRAVDKDICREVAVKFLLNNADDRQKARFVEEAQITGQLEHPNIVPIHQLGVDGDGCSFFSMKMVKGRSVADILKGEPSRVSGRSPGEYTLGRLLNIMISICNALAYAHSRQVIHRDLKPANIMVGDFGEVYVMDWGLAKVLGKEDKPAGEVPRACGVTRLTPHARSTSPAGLADSQDKVTTPGRGQGELTQAGAVMGTPAYMPPEQALGNLDDVDERSDIYSLGAILYEMMTLTPPVGRGGDMVAILMRVVEGEIDPPAQRAPERARAGWIAPELSAIALKALAKKPKHRYQSVEELKRDVERFLEGRSVSAKQDSMREMVWKLMKRNKGASIGVGLALLVLLTSLVFISSAWWETVLAKRETDKAYNDYRQEQEARKKQQRDSAPALVGAARFSAENLDLDAALKQLDLASSFDPDHAPAYLLAGQVKIAKFDFAGADASLERYLKMRPDDADAAELHRLAQTARAEDGERGK